MGREPKLIVATGKKGVGKSFLTMQYIRKYVRPNPAVGWVGRKALLYDVNNEYNDQTKFPDIKALSLNDVAKYSAHPKIEIRRIPPFFRTGEEMPPDVKAKAVLHILLNFRNGLILLEDINNYISDFMPKDVVGTILSQRHKGIDIILHYQAVGRIQSKVWPHINVLRMHKTSDSVARHWEKFPDKYEMLQIAEYIINARYLKGDIRFHLHVDFDAEKIYGDFSMEEFESAVDDYVALNYAKIVQPLMNKRDSTGKKVYAGNDAVAELKKKYTSLYLP